MLWIKALKMDFIVFTLDLHVLSQWLCCVCVFVDTSGLISDRFWSHWALTMFLLLLWCQINYNNLRWTLILEWNMNSYPWMKASLHHLHSSFLSCIDDVERFLGNDLILLWFMEGIKWCPNAKPKFAQINQIHYEISP